MQTVTAALVSKSKDGKRAMVIVRGEVDGKPYTATRHVKRQLKNGPFIGANPNPQTAVERQRAYDRVLFAKKYLHFAEGALNDVKSYKDATADDLNKTTLNVGRAKASLMAAEENQQKVEAAYPLQVQFEF